MKKIGEGRNAEIFALDDHLIAKVFHEHIPVFLIDEENKVSKKVQELGLKVPKVFDKKEILGREAIIYERVNGQTVLADLIQHPEKAAEMGKIMAQLHYPIHLESGAGFPSLKENLYRQIKGTELKEEEKERIIDYIDQRPDRFQLCHGDFHPDNILVNSDGATVIDWTTAVCGNPLADAARTSMILKYAALPEELPEPIKTAFEQLRGVLLQNYLDTYLELSGSRLEDIMEWEIPVMAARLSEGVPDEEKNRILEHIRTEKRG